MQKQTPNYSDSAGLERFTFSSGRVLNQYFITNVFWHYYTDIVDVNILLLFTDFHASSHSVSLWGERVRWNHTSTATQKMAELLMMSQMLLKPQQLNLLYIYLLQPFSTWLAWNVKKVWRSLLQRRNPLKMLDVLNSSHQVMDTKGLHKGLKRPHGWATLTAQHIEEVTQRHTDGQGLHKTQ